MPMVATSQAGAPATIRTASPWLVRFGRLGYIAKGAVYIVVGFLATEAAFHKGGRTTDSRGALRAIGQGPLGKFALIIILIGLFGYAAWRLVSAATDAEGRGDEPAGAALRIGDALRGLAYGSLGIWTVKYLTSHNASNGNQTRGIVDRVLGWPAGRWIVVLAGFGIIGYAFYQIYRAASGKFMKRLELSSAGVETKTWVERFGTFGISARAIVFGMIGVLLTRAGWAYDPSKAGGIRQSLDAISREPKGHILFGIVAVGLIAFGLFELATARYRRMRATSPS